jgi:predicted DNA binding CopG/RHH family protein
MEKNEKLVAIRMPVSLWQEIKKRAEAELVTPSNYVRRVLIKSFENRKREEASDEQRN